jgi:uncharacterized SAM-binding protein YcdF (DUF218 family)
MSYVFLWLWAFLKPANFLGLLLLLGLLGTAFGYRKTGLALLTFSIASILIVAVTPVARMTIAPLENRFPRPETITGPVHGILLLGGVSNASISARRGSLDVNASGDRLIETAALALRFPEAAIWILGRREGRSIARILTELGIAADRVHFESTSINTHQNLALAKPLAKPRCDERWILVTSAWHMPRAIAVTRSLGWPIIALPSDYRTHGGQTRWFNPELADSLVIFNMAVKEWLGLLIYRLRGWTEEVWPAPGTFNACDTTSREAADSKWRNG